MIMRTDHSRKYHSNGSPVRCHSNRGTRDSWGWNRILQWATNDYVGLMKTSADLLSRTVCCSLSNSEDYYDSTRNGFWATRNGWSISASFPFPSIRRGWQLPKISISCFFQIFDQDHPKKWCQDQDHLGFGFHAYVILKPLPLVKLTDGPLLSSERFLF